MIIYEGPKPCLVCQLGKEHKLYRAMRIDCPCIIRPMIKTNWRVKRTMEIGVVNLPKKIKV